MSSLVLILGGARSGKSAFALEYAMKEEKRSGGAVCYIATAQALDDEMRRRIRKHREDRPAHWHTIESPLSISESFSHLPANTVAVVVDCLTLLVSNILLSHEGAEEREITALVLQEIESALRAAENSARTVLFVSNEVGLGIVPEYPLSRSFRDIAGLVNQKVAKHADEVYVMIAGIPQRIK